MSLEHKSISFSWKSSRTVILRDRETGGSPSQRLAFISLWQPGLAVEGPRLAVEGAGLALPLFTGSLPVHWSNWQLLLVTAS